MGGGGGEKLSRDHYQLHNGIRRAMSIESSTGGLASSRRNFLPSIEQ
jgi:hypothetical protein